VVSKADFPAWANSEADGAADPNVGAVCPNDDWPNDDWPKEGCENAEVGDDCPNADVVCWPKVLVVDVWPKGDPSG
jgi:hypothetical protein